MMSHFNLRRACRFSLYAIGSPRWRIVGLVVPLVACWWLCGLPFMAGYGVIGAMVRENAAKMSKPYIPPMIQ